MRGVYANVFVLEMCGQMPRGRVTSVVEVKDEGAIRRVAIDGTSARTIVGLS